MLRNFKGRNARNRFGALMLFVAGGVMSYAVERMLRARISEERKRANEMLRESEQRLRLALESGEMGMWEWVVGSDQTEWDKKKYELVGFPVGDGHVSTELAFSSLHPDDAPAYKRALDEVLEQGRGFIHEYRIIRPDGQVRWLAERGRVFRDADGKPLKMVGITYDNTSSRLAEEELRARADELAVVMDTVPAITIITHDTDFRQLSFNKQARRLLRLAEGETISASKEARPWIFRPMKDGKELASEEFPLRVAATGREVRNFELTLLFNDGTSRDILGDAVPLFDRHGKVRGAVGAFLDITERKKTQMELLKAHGELEKRVEERTAELTRAMEALNKETEERIQALDALRKSDQLLIHQSRLAAMGEMMSNIAHQWRQPLNSIGLIVQELPVMYGKGDFSEEYLKTMVEKAKLHVFNMSKTIEDFKNFFQPNKERVGFKAREGLGNALALIRDSFDTLHIRIEVDAVGDQVIYGYPSEFSQALLNIFLNSRDAFLESKEDLPRIIRVRIFPRNCRTVIAIKDNAGGIPEEVITKIFDPYFTTKNKGTGIGLFMTKTIIEKHMNGRLSVENVDGGTEVWIEVDAEAPDQGPAHTESDRS